MADLRERFDVAAREVQGLPKRPDNDTLLRLYGLYKQATSGDVKGSRPGMLDPVGRAKWDAWAARKGTAPDEARRLYVGLVDELLRTLG